MSNLAIANEIRSQLMGLGRIKVWSWGAHNWAGGDNYLQFKVNGLKFKGWVKITLDLGMDLYNIEFLKRGGVVAKSVEGIYFDDMVDIIDRYVEIGERNSDYSKKDKEVIKQMYGF